MDAELKRQWIDALRSGEYEQGTGSLRSEDDHYCCLGVLCNVMDPAGWNVHEVEDDYYARTEDGTEDATYHQEIAGYNGPEFYPNDDLPDMKEIGIDSDTVALLAKMNDGDGTGETRVPPASFAAIADYIAKHL